MAKKALIVGVGTGISASFARALAADGYQVALTARNTDKLRALKSEVGASVYSCDASDGQAVSQLFSELDSDFGTADVVLYNPSMRVPGEFTKLDPEEVLAATKITSHGAFLVAQQSIKRMLSNGGGKLFFTGATASVKGFPGSSAFAMGKFALRGLAQSLGREFAPQGIHVAHFVIDGSVRVPGRDYSLPRFQNMTDEDFLDPDAIAETYMHVLKQPASAWMHEIDLRPASEKF